MVSDWLPAEQNLPAILQGQAEPLLESWVGRWFVDARPRLAAVRRSAELSVQERSGWQLRGEGCLSTRGRARDYLLASALGSGALEPSGPDAQIIDRFYDAMLGDLEASLASLMGSGGGQSVRSSVDDWILDVSDEAGARIIRLQVPAHAASTSRRKGAPARRRRAELLVRAEDALQSSKVRLAARLGEVSASLDEVRDLGEGDLLVLERDAGEPIDLVVATSGARVAGARFDLESGSGNIVVEA